MSRFLPRMVVLSALAACGNFAGAGGTLAPDRTPQTLAAPPPLTYQAAAVFGGGCFWCMEKPFDKVPGVLSTTSGYTGGEIAGPSYGEVSSHATQHIEALRVVYDPAVVTYAQLLQVFWHNIDPTQANGQFCDKGHQYSSAVFTDDPEERKLALRSKKEVQARLGEPVVTLVLPDGPFWIAEGYHQDFYKKSPDHYTRYRTGCGRDRRLKELWADDAGH
jgi:peptide-methionine (S)-S-oxide reductase